MSNIAKSEDFFKQFYDNQNKKVATQISETYKANSSNTNYDNNYSKSMDNFVNRDKDDQINNHRHHPKENNDFEKLKNNINRLTNYMKDVLNNDNETKICNEKIDDEDAIEREFGKAEKSFLNHSLRTGLVDAHSDNVIVQSVSSDPLHSVKSFQDLKLKIELLNGISSMGFRKPSGIQERALPLLLQQEPKNIIAQSQSGTGKTATFLLTMLSKMDLQQNHCQCLCMAPTRELVLQIAEVAQTMSRFMSKVKITCAIKGQAPETRNGEIDSHIVIGTPGTLKFWTTDNSNFYLNPKKLKVFVLDEADVLIEDPEFLNIAKRIKSKVTNDCQILLFSATYDGTVMNFANEFVPNPTQFSIKPQELTLKNIKQYFIKMESPEEKYPTLVNIYGMKSMGQCIIFCESRRMALHLQKRLEQDSHLSSLLTGELDVMKRQQEIDDFRNGKSRVLIATNLCARGIDIPQVNLIINWDMPKTKDGNPDCETYLHRIGRSGRFGKMGLTINFIVTDSDLMIQNKIIERYGGRIEEMTDLSIVASI